LSGHHRLAAARAHLFELAGDHEAAITHYRAAASRTASIPERNYLMTQAARLKDAVSEKQAIGQWKPPAGMR
jgi:predicted RNA polymerase sigma factor